MSTLEMFISYFWVHKINMELLISQSTPVGDNAQDTILNRLQSLSYTGLGPCRALKVQRSLCTWGGGGQCMISYNK